MRKDFARHRYELQQITTHPLSKPSKREKKRQIQLIEFDMELLNKKVEVCEKRMLMRVGLAGNKLIIICSDGHETHSILIPKE